MNIFYLSLKEGTPARGYWDQFLIEELLFDCPVVDRIEDADIVIIPGAYQFHLIKEINQELSKLEKVTVIITSDEENRFPLHELKHKDMKLFGTYPHETSVNVAWLPIGYPPHIKEKAYKEKTIDVLYAGQVNHKDREELVEELKKLNGIKGEAYLSNGFAQGLSPKEYIEKTCQSKVVPCPKGNINYDSFRTYEALECGAVPITQNPSFWQFLNVPFPVVENKDQWRGYIQDALAKYPTLNNDCQAWWIRKKHNIRKMIVDKEEQMTVIIPISPIKSHPSIHILKETIASIRFHTKDQIILAFDGVRPEQEHMRKNYEEHIREVLFNCTEWGNIYPIIFKEHKHQSGMLKEIIPTIKTPLIMFIEQDTPIVIDEPIRFDKIKDFILSGQSNLVRFYHEAFIHPEHKHMMLETKDIFTETYQWSSRPHVSSTAFYNRLLGYFSENSKCFTEDYLHGKEHEDFIKYDRQGWEQWKTHLYNPGGNIKRSLHTDGRAGEPKLDNTQIW